MVYDSDEPFTVLCSIGKQELKTYGLIDIGATGGNFVDEQTAQRIYKLEGIQSLALSRPKAVKGYNGPTRPLIRYAIYLRLQVQTTSKTSARS